MNGKSISVAILGCGVVGSGLVRVLLENAREMEHRIGAPVQVHSISVADLDKPRPEWTPRALLTRDALAAVRAPEVDIVAECIGGTGAARELVEAAIAAGKHVATANKELIAKHGRELLALADEADVDFRYEASVAGGIPIIRALRTSLAADRVERVLGIVNGTTNYILTRMTRDGMSFEEALTQAQDLGFAEADPSNDIDGFDAACKLGILASMAFGSWVDLQDVHYEGIRGLSEIDIRSADRLGYLVKLLAIGRRDESERYTLKVHPTLVPKSHPLASVTDEYNAVFVNSAHCKELMFYGPGAGSGATGSAMAGDLLDIARDIVHGIGASVPLGRMERPEIVPVDDTSSRFYVRMIVEDTPGVIGSVAQVFGKHRVSLSTCLADGIGGGKGCILWITSPVEERHFRAALRDIALIPTVHTIAASIRVEA